MMITLDKIKENPSIYKEKKIVLWGCGNLGKSFFNLSKTFDFPVLFCCSNDESTWGSIFFEVPILSPKELKEKCATDTNIVLQLAVGKQHDAQVAQQAKELGFQVIVESISNSYDLDKISLALLAQQAPAFSSHVQSMMKEVLAEEKDYNTSLTIRNPALYEHLVVCQPGKTGDMTIISTYNKATGSNIYHTHAPVLFSPPNTDKTIKVITGIRDPIARDISAIFQRISNGRILREPEVTTEKMMDYLERHSVQELFDIVSENRCRGVLGGGTPAHDYTTFFHSFSNHILDIKKFSFDKEKGFSIFKEGNVEVFMYQLEKLNDSISALSQWLDLPFKILENDNVASEKWIGNDYKVAQKELEFSWEYLDLCYNDPYVRHCYSEADIQTFKDRWANNIKETK